MRILAVIPARLNSTRLPNKPLIKIAGQPLIQRVYNAVVDCPYLDKVVVATDSKEVFDCIESIGGSVKMTSKHHLTGTDRIIEVLSQYEEVKDYYDIILNIQGDEPFVDYQTIKQLIDPFVNDVKQEIAMTTLKQVIDNQEDISNPNIVKIVTDCNDCALYFSRFPIPFWRNDTSDDESNKTSTYKHVGLYGYTSDFIKKYSQMTQTPLEKSEKLEQLRVIENNYKIYVTSTSRKLIDINIPEDIKKAENLILKDEVSLS